MNILLKHTMCGVECFAGDTIMYGWVRSPSSRNNGYTPNDGSNSSIGSRATLYIL